MKTRVDIGPPECPIIAAIGIFLEGQPDIGVVATLCSQSIYIGQVGFRLSVNVTGDWLNLWEHLDDEGKSFQIGKVDLNDPNSLMEIWDRIDREFRAFTEISNQNAKMSPYPSA